MRFLLFVLIFLKVSFSYGQNKVHFDKLFASAPHLDFPFYIKVPIDDIQYLPIDTVCMKSYFGINEVSYKIPSFNKQMETWSGEVELIKECSIINSWQSGNNMCFLIDTNQRGPGNAEDIYNVYLCVTSIQGSFINRVLVHNLSFALGENLTFVIISNNKFRLFDYQNNEDSSKEANVENESKVKICDYLITEDGFLSKSKCYDVLLKDSKEAYQFYNRNSDDPFNEFVK